MLENMIKDTENEIKDLKEGLEISKKKLGYLSEKLKVINQRWIDHYEKLLVEAENRLEELKIKQKGEQS